MLEQETRCSLRSESGLFWKPFGLPCRARSQPCPSSPGPHRCQLRHPMELQLCKEFVQTCPSTATSSLPEDTLLGGEVDLDGGVAPGVVDLASVDLLDGHPAGETADLKGSCTIKIWYVLLCSLNIFLSFSDLSSLSACVTSRLQPMGSCYQARQLPRRQK